MVKQKKNMKHTNKRTEQTKTKTKKNEQKQI